MLTKHTTAEHTTAELIKVLRAEAIFQYEKFRRKVLADELTDAADALETLDYRAASENKALEQLKTENEQLRDVIVQMDPDFFKRKCRICGCDWNHPCNNHDFWVEDDLCSACACYPEATL